jgi:hypothetical protein
MATGYTVESLYFRRLRDSGVSESLRIREDGEAVISSYVVHGSTFRQFPDRTLDGQPVLQGNGEDVGALQALQGHGDYIGAVAFWRPLAYDVFPPSRGAHWRRRVLQLNHDRNEDVTWWMVRDASDEGRAYLAGYSLSTSLPVGYIGRRGFYSVVPPRSEQFATGRMELNQWLDVGVQRDSDSRYERCIYLLDEDRLQEIQLRTHAVRTVAEIPDALSIAVVGMPLSADDTESDMEIANQRRNTVTRVAAWVGDQLAMIDPASGKRVDLALPDELGLSSRFDLYFVDANQSVVVSYPDEQNPYRQRVTWLGRDGQPTREETVELAGRREPTPRERAAAFGFVIPAPALLAIGLVWVSPSAMLQHGSAASYWQAVAKTVDASWPVIVIMTAACGAAALFVYWQERRRGGVHALAWSATAFCLGLPGLVAYFAERRTAPLGCCDACGRSAPRNRPACTRCGHDFARPRLLGTEVFA